MNTDSNNSNTIKQPSIREIKIGGMTKVQLIKELEQQAIHLNKSAEQLLSSDAFTVSIHEQLLRTIEITVQELGFPNGAAMQEIFNKAIQNGFDLCPLELGPFMRLQFQDQPEGYLNKPVTQNQAPYGSITIASKILKDYDDFPKGFYLRKINGELWLRGYHASLEFVWNPEDCFVFLFNQ